MTASIRNNARILRYAFLSALADLKAVYTWQTWAFGWLTRLLCQVAFFALIGRLIGPPDATTFLVVGNAVFVAAQTVLLTVSSTAWERFIGTFPLLVAAPGSLFTVFAGRSVQWMLDGLACATVSLFVIGPLFGVALPMPAALLAVPLIGLICLSVYAFALVLGGLVLRAMQLRSLVGNLAAYTLMLFAGVQVPAAFWSGAIQVVSRVLPMSHGLQAVRDLLRSAAPAAVAREAAIELAVGAGWLLAAMLVFRLLAGGGRRTGSIEFGG